MTSTKHFYTILHLSDPTDLTLTLFDFGDQAVHDKLITENLNKAGTN